MATEVTIYERPYLDYVESIRRGDTFTFSRWGDGEWRVVLGKRGRNCDHHEYYPAMGEELRKVLSKRPSYRLGLQRLALRLFNRSINHTVKQYGLRQRWENADVFHKASIRGRLEPLTSALNERHVLLIGPEHLKQLTLFDFRHVPVPMKNCYLKLDKIESGIIKRMNQIGRRKVVIGFSAGMPSEILIDRCFRRWKYEHFLIDFGSLWDPYAGVQSRTYHKRLKL